MGHPNWRAEDPLFLRIERLRRLSLFVELKDNDVALQAVAKLMSEAEFGPGHEILKEGTSGNELYILLEGHTIIYKKTPQGDRYRVGELRAENHVFFGEGGLLDSEARSATIQAQTNCRCLVLKRDDFLVFCQEHPEWAISVLLHIARLVNRRARKANQDLLLLYNALVAEIQGS